MGNAYFELGEFEEARKSYLNALLYKPDYPEAKNDLALLYMNPDYKGCDVKLAEKYHLEAVEMASNEERKEKLRNQFEMFRKRFLPQRHDKTEKRKARKSV